MNDIQEELDQLDHNLPCQAEGLNTWESEVGSSAMVPMDPWLRSLRHPPKAGPRARLGVEKDPSKRCFLVIPKDQNKNRVHILIGS